MYVCRSKMNVLPLQAICLSVCLLSSTKTYIASQICAGLKALTTSPQYTVQFDSYKRLKLSGISRVSSTQEPADPVWNDASLFPLLSEGCLANTASHEGSAISANTNTQIHKHKYKKTKVSFLPPPSMLACQHSIARRRRLSADMISSPDSG